MLVVMVIEEIEAIYQIFHYLLKIFICVYYVAGNVLHILSGEPDLRRWYKYGDMCILIYTSEMF